MDTVNFRSLRDSQGDMCSEQSQQLKEGGGPEKSPEEEAGGVVTLNDGSWGLPKLERCRGKGEPLRTGTEW